MKCSLRSLLKRKWISVGLILIIALGFCAWMFGWGGGNINVIPFDADDVEHIELFGVRCGAMRSAYLTEAEDIQALIDSVNSFRYSGSGLKDIFKYGIGSGGTLLYLIRIYPHHGERFTVCFGLSDSDQDPSNTEVSYKVYNSLIEGFSKNCKGSMQVIYDFLERETIVN